MAAHELSFLSDGFSAVLSHPLLHVRQRTPQTALIVPLSQCQQRHLDKTDAQHCFALASYQPVSWYQLVNTLVVY